MTAQSGRGAMTGVAPPRTGSALRPTGDATPIGADEAFGLPAAGRQDALVGGPRRRRWVGSARPTRDLHPGAWWLWALGMAVAASRTTNPLVLGPIIGVVAVVVSARRTDAPWARGFGFYLAMAGVVIGLRVLFRMVLDGQYGGTVLFTLPEVPLPDGAAGVRIGGPVSLEGIVAAAYDGLRLATMLLCLGAANVLANPKRLLRSLPAALFEVGVAVTVALSVAPQLVESALRVHRSRRLRGGHGRRTRLFRQVVVPVMTDALDRSLALAAAMDSRGYGRNAADGTASRTAGLLLLAGLCGVCVGTYGVLDATTPAALGVPLLVAGAAVAVGGLALGGRRVRRSRYRPDPWAAPEWVVAGSGALVGAGLVALARSGGEVLHPSLSPLVWPVLSVPVTLVVLAGLVPAVVTPTVPRRRRAAADPAGAVDHAAHGAVDHAAGGAVDLRGRGGTT